MDLARDDPPSPGMPEIRSTKPEIRNNFKIQIFKTRTTIIDQQEKKNPQNRFEFLSFDIRICFEFRYSNFGFNYYEKLFNCYQ